MKKIFKLFDSKVNSESDINQIIVDTNKFLDSEIISPIELTKQEFHYENYFLNFNSIFEIKELQECFYNFLKKEQNENHFDFLLDVGI